MILIPDVQKLPVIRPAGPIQQIGGLFCVFHTIPVQFLNHGRFILNPNTMAIVAVGIQRNYIHLLPSGFMGFTSGLMKYLI